MSFRIPTALALPILLLACGPAPDATRTADTAPGPYPDDPHSYSRPDRVAVTHLTLDLRVDFDARRLTGRASLDLDNRLADSQGPDELILDTRDLEIDRVTLGDGTETGFTLGAPDPDLSAMGRPLTIAVTPDTRTVHVDYTTSPGAAALQWLDPAQTAGDHPFLFTQSQAILARTWIPLQDTPAVRFTYDATVRVPPGLLAVMSADNPGEPAADGVYTFSMPQPVPSYLMALAVGDLELRDLGERSGVYAEPAVIDAAAHEFADTGEMIDAAEALYGPYRWGRYDLLVLPPSFPFGGMENPRLTFLTPTVIAGDRSLVALVAHELAHSWSGNLVTNANWNDFWLNEGFTVYLERRIMERLYGRDYAEMLAALGRQDLAEKIAELGPGSADTHLHLDLAGRDPDDGMTDVAYEKGALFLRMLEERVGRERWDAFLTGYFDRFAFRSMDSAGFVAYLEDELLEPEGIPREELRIDEWIHGPGVPANAPEIESDAFARVETEIERWQGGADP
ncbi:MAG: M1 family aminopeptidase/hydrolase, partial [Acidobacteriota bacterium]